MSDLNQSITDAAKRTLDITLSAAMLTASTPLWLPLLAVLAITRRQWPLRRTRRVGRFGRRFHEYSLPLPRGGYWNIVRRWPRWINVLAGHLSLVGPRPVGPWRYDAIDPAISRRFDVRPGLVCLWWIRRRANIGYHGEWPSDIEYVESHSLLADLGVLLRAAAAGLYGDSRRDAPSRITLFGIPVDNLPMAAALRAIGDQLDGDKPHQLCFVNADCVNIAMRDDEYLATLRNSSLVLADGIGMKLAGRVLHSDIRENLCGTDLFPRLCAAMAGTGKKLYLLGGRPGVPEAVCDWIAREHPGTIVAGCRHGYFTDAEQPEVIRHIAESGADVLLVAMGAPRQDTWIARNLPNLNVKLAMGVGGLFDYYSGRIPRAPMWIREIGMEWLYRMYQEPSRLWRRYVLGNVMFLLRLTREAARAG